MTTTPTKLFSSVRSAFIIDMIIDVFHFVNNILKIFLFRCSYIDTIQAKINRLKPEKNRYMLNIPMIIEEDLRWQLCDKFKINLHILILVL